jgi:hypothetical protein
MGDLKRVPENKGLGFEAEFHFYCECKLNKGNSRLLLIVS